MGFFYLFHRQISRFQITAFLTPLLAQLVISVWFVWQIPKRSLGLFGINDDLWAAWNVEGILKWGFPFDMSPFTLLVGTGSVFLPNLPWLNPGALALGLPFSTETNYLISSFIYLAELNMSVILLAIALGLSTWRSIIIAQIYSFVLLQPPYFGALQWLWLAPVNAHLISVMNLIFYFLIKVGRVGITANFCYIAVVLGFSIIGLISAPVTILTYLPVYLPMMIVFFFACGMQRTEIIWKISGGIVIILSLWALGFVDYLAVTAANSSRSLAEPAIFSAKDYVRLDYWRDLWRQYSICGVAVQEMFCRRFPIFWFHVLALLGAVYQIILPTRRTFRWLGIAFLAYLGSILLLGFLRFGYLPDFVRVLRTSYVQWAGYCFTAFFILSFLDFPLQLLKSRRRKVYDAFVFPTTIFFVWTLPALLFISWKFGPVFTLTPNLPPGTAEESVFEKFAFRGTSPVRSPQIGAINKYLVEHASIGPGQIFRGYTVTYLGDKRGFVRAKVGYTLPNKSWTIYIHARQILYDNFGGDFMETDLWNLGIPTLEEFGQWVSKQMQIFVMYFFSEENDETNPAILRIYHLDIEKLKWMGVRFIITDIPPHELNAELRAYEQSADGNKMFLYEIQGTNLADFSPVRVKRVTTLQQVLDEWKKPGYNPVSTALAFEEIAGPLVRADMSQLYAQKDGFRVVASSHGRSLILLPVQFSECLVMDRDRADAKLVRLNGVQTGLLFSGRVDSYIRFESGLGGSSACRARDSSSLQTYGVLELLKYKRYRFYNMGS